MNKPVGYGQLSKLGHGPGWLSRLLKELLSQLPVRLLREGQRGTRNTEKVPSSRKQRKCETLMCAQAHPGEHQRYPILLFAQLLPRYAAGQRTCFGS